jgi:acetyl-CoA acetyltransferase family protein
MHLDLARRDIVLLSAVRTPFGTLSGSLKSLTATDLAVPAAEAALQRAGVAPDEIDQVIFGNVLQTAKDAIYLARHVGLRAGVPQEAPALTLNRLCGSGFQSVVSAAEQILTGQASVVLAGGTESMTQAPHVVHGLRDGLRFGQDAQMVDLLFACLTDSYTGCAMAITAENLGERHGITREDVDAYAMLSQQRWKAAHDAGRFADELAPLTLAGRKGPVSFTADEHARPETTLDALARLRPVFKKDGLVTAGNASGIGDGAGAIVVADGKWAEKRGLQPIARLVGWGIAGVDPTIMGIGPVPASRRALEMAGLGLDDMALVEVNEAFAAQYLAVEKELGLDRSITNVNGGAIALAHPLAASGTRITATIVHELRRRGERYGLASACIGGGQGIAVVVEAL